MKNAKKSLSHIQAVFMFLMLTVTLHVLGLKIYGIIIKSHVISDYITYGSKILGVILIVEMLLFVYLSPMKCNWKALHWFSRENRKSLIISFVISLLVIGGLLGFRVYMNAKNPLYREIPMFGLYLNLHARWFYPVNIVFQEFFIKAFTQENIGIALLDENSENKTGFNVKHALMTSFTTSIFFFVLHLQYELYYMTGAFLLCFITGMLYEKDRNIWGAVMVHVAIGFLPRCFGVLQILEGTW